MEEEVEEEVGAQHHRRGLQQGCEGRSPLCQAWYEYDLTGPYPILLS